jgi:hypothetical protein
MAIWQHLVSEIGFTSGYQSVRRFVGKLRGMAITQAHPVIVTALGQVGVIRPERFLPDARARL